MLFLGFDKPYKNNNTKYKKKYKMKYKSQNYSNTHTQTHKQTLKLKSHLCVECLISKEKSKTKK